VITIIGKTEEGDEVVTGVAKFYFQEGLPLCFIFDELKKKKMVPSWINLYMDLKENGMPRERIIHLLNEHIFESYGKEYRDTVISRLQKIFK
jgi:hypothetical protein